VNLTSGLNAGSATLNNGLKEMRLHWDQTKAEWNDAVSHNFEEQHWLPLEARVVAALRAMDRLAPILSKVQHDCE
jgi:hypothetical protein